MDRIIRLHDYDDMDFGTPHRTQRCHSLDAS